jgi:uncharacterized circularly permuted ATP-grasp superfamily protein
VRTGEDEFYVLEDNARTPSGVSYMLENRETMLQMFPELFAKHRVQPSGLSADAALAGSPRAPAHCDGEPTVAVLTPGIYNSAYFEHAFLADQMGVELVEGTTCVSSTGVWRCARREGYKPIDVLYRRVDDAFLDPLNFNPDSTLGVPGIMDVYRAGASPSPMRRAPASPTTRRSIQLHAGYRGVLHRRKTVPEQRADLALFGEEESLAYVLDNLDDLVVKEVHGSGGYGMLVGPTASKKEIAKFREEAEGAAGQLHRAADAGAVDRADLHRRRAWRRGMSICGPSCWSRPTRSASRRAG